MLGRLEMEKEGLESEYIALEKSNKKLAKETRDLQKKHERYAKT